MGVCPSTCLRVTSSQFSEPGAGLGLRGGRKLPCELREACPGPGPGPGPTPAPPPLPAALPSGARPFPDLLAGSPCLLGPRDSAWAVLGGSAEERAACGPLECTFNLIDLSLYYSA